MLLPRGAFAEYRRADADHRRTLFNRNFEVVSHTHRQFSWLISERAAARKFISQLTQLTKERAVVFRVFKKRRQSHQANKLEPVQWSNLVDELRQLTFINAALGYGYP